MKNNPYIMTCKVKEIRKLRGLSQEELAAASFTTQNTISAIESGVFEPRLITAYCISRALKCSIYDLWGLDHNIN